MVAAHAPRHTPFRPAMQQMQHMQSKLPHFSWDSHKLKKRKYVLLPWISDPTSGAQQEQHNGKAQLVFAQRHEANTMELFFDLFFVANLALFTQYHSIIDYKGFLSYIEFFGLLWGTWFSITLYDVRFAIDSVYERACKLIQFAIFVVFALVGSEFEPGGDASDDNNVNFRILSYVLCASRLLLMIQYIVVLFFVTKRGWRKLMFPLGLNAFWYFVTAVVFGAMTLAFRNGAPTIRHIYLVWYVAMGLEVVFVLSVSTIWRTLSFKLTHLAERMSLLTLIIIGEGIIGITKTISIIMGSGPDLEYFGLVFVILLIIFWLYMIYFDNTPRGHFGTIRQQFWAFLHFPLHLAIVGIVEGAQQLVRSRYVLRKDQYLVDSLMNYCFDQRLDGEKMMEKLLDLIKYFELEKKAASNQFVPDIKEIIASIGDDAGICKTASLEESLATWEFPGDMEALWSNFASAIYAQTVTDQQIPSFVDPIHSGANAWRVAYFYFWGAVALLSFTTILMHFLCRKSRRDVLSYFGVAIRVIVMIVAIGLGAHAQADVLFFVAIMTTTAVVPTAMGCLFLIVSVDSWARLLSNYALRHTKKEFIDDEADAAAHDHFHVKEEDEIELKEHDETANTWYGGATGTAYMPPTPGSGGSAPGGYQAVHNPGSEQHTPQLHQYTPSLEQHDSVYQGNYGYGGAHSRNNSEAYDNPNFRGTGGFSSNV